MWGGRSQERSTADGTFGVVAPTSITPYVEVVLAASTSTVASAPSAEADPTWTQVGQFWVSLVGVVVTFGAVMVALFGQRWHASRKRPKLTLRVDQVSSAWPRGSDSSATTMWMRLVNAAGRDPAHDVEVFVSMAGKVADPEVPGGVAFDILAEDEALAFGSPMRGRAEETRATVPAGHSRWLAFADVGEPVSLARKAKVMAMHVDEERARLCVDSPDEPLVPWLDFDVDYTVEIVITGSNFDALRFRGKFGCHRAPDDLQEHGEGTEMVDAGWIERPAPLKGDASKLSPLVEEVMG